MHWHEIRGHLLTTTGTRLEDVGVQDFIDIVYSYSVNGPSDRSAFRTSVLGYVFDFNDKEPDEDKTFEGFKKSATSQSMLDELDAFGVG